MSDIYSSHMDNIPKAHKCLTKTATFKAEPDIDENLQNKFLKYISYQQLDG